MNNTYDFAVTSKLAKKHKISKRLKLNAHIDVEGPEPAEVASEWLTQEGFVTDG